MQQEEISKLTTEELRQKERTYKSLVAIFWIGILGSLLFIIWDLISKDSFSPSNAIIGAVVILIGQTTVFPKLKVIQKELKQREQTIE